MSLNTRETYILYQIIKSDDYITSKELSLLFDVSIRTIKSDINKINSTLSEIFTNTRIASKARLGYIFESELSDIEMRMKEVFPFDDNVSTLKSDHRERIYYLIKKLLLVDYPIKIEQLMDELFLSRTMLSALLKEVREKLLKYRLVIVSIPHHGIIVEGKESDRRLAITEYTFHSGMNIEYSLRNQSMFTSEDSKKEYDDVVEMIVEVCKRYKIDLSNYNVNNFAIHVIVGVRRALLYNYNIIEDLNSIDLIDSIEFKAATDIVRYLEETYGLLLPIGETIYYANHLQTKRILLTNELNSSEIEKLEACLSDIIDEINNNFEFDFSTEGELYNHLYLHIPQMINRIKKNMIARNPLVYDSVRRYLFAAKVTHSACDIINRYYNIEVEINEFGYLMLYFNMAIIQFEMSKPMNIAILSGRGRPESLMYLNEIKETFSSKKFNVFEIDKYEENLDYDIIISTYDVAETTDVNMFVIEDDNYLQKLRDRINSIRYRSLDIDTYFKPEFFTVSIDGETKEEVTRNLFKQLAQEGLTKHVDQKKMKMMDSELGNGVVHFQDTLRFLKKGMFYIAILSKPVFWDNSVAKILIITKTKKSEDKDLLNYCRVVSQWVSDKAMINGLLKDKRFEVLYEDIQTILGE